MKKILIATTNKDKYTVVCYLLEKTCFQKKNNFQFFSLNDINYQAKEEKEKGSIIERAKNKAITIKNYLMKNNLNIYEYIIGIDDGIILKGKLHENIKDYLKKILLENYLEDGEPIIFYRAFYIISKENKDYEAITNVPYKYRPKINAIIKDNSYPLKQVCVPLDSNKTLMDLTEEEGCLYCLSHSKESLMKLKNVIFE